MYNNVFHFKSGIRYYYFKVKKDNKILVTIDYEIKGGEIDFIIFNRDSKSTIVNETLTGSHIEYELSEGKYVLKIVYKKARGGLSIHTRRI